MGKFFIWKVHAEFDVQGIKVKSIATGPAESIYKALMAAKSCYHRNFPTLDPGNVFIDFAEADGQADENETHKGWRLAKIDEV